jgi:hypothetical protein
LSVMPKESDETYTRVDVEKLRFLLTSTSWITTRNIKQPNLSETTGNYGDLYF